mgnify:CR=1 FL=1
MLTHLGAPLHAGPCEFKGATRLVRLREVFTLFRGAFCPKVFQTMLKGQFLVSGARIAANPLEKYRLM